MSISKLWEPLVDLLFQETSTFVPAEIVGIELSTSNPMPVNQLPILESVRPQSRANQPNWLVFLTVVDIVTSKI